MKKEYKAHPLMIFNFMTPFLWILVLPVIRAVIAYIRFGGIGSLIIAEIILLSVIFAVSVGRWKAFRIYCNKNTVTVKSGFFVRRQTSIDINKLSSIQTERGIPDCLLGAVTFRLNTEAGARVRRHDFEFILSRADALDLSKKIYGNEVGDKQKFSAVKSAALAVATSSVFSGALIGIPLINNAGNLFGFAVRQLVLDEIGSVYRGFDTKIPYVINLITAVLFAAFSVSFIYQFLKFINFGVRASSEQIEVTTGFLTKERTRFKCSAVNDVRIEQTPLMLLINRYTMKASIAGFSNGKKEAQVTVPIKDYRNIKSDFSEFFPFLSGKTEFFSHKKSKINLFRFLYVPILIMGAIIALFILFALLFKPFFRFTLFVASVSAVLDIFYGYLCFTEYKRSKISIGDTLCLCGKRGLRTSETYCSKEKAGEIKIIRTPADYRFGTCKVRITVCSESADTLVIRHLDYETARRKIFESFGV